MPAKIDTLSKPSKQEPKFVNLSRAVDGKWEKNVISSGLFKNANENVEIAEKSKRMDNLQC